MKTSRKPAYRLTFDDAIDIWIRHWDGEYQHQTAAAYDVNQGRICDVLKGRLHPGSERFARRKRSAA
jgi:hypothetical protein